ncbi:hypothetical protein BRD04_09055 [Halobacteriales archaeon QS_9_67_17]|nr:MAG: hypothetical protein BRD04_09055 [Halobacteriales archaeon QS_9_67_17]
MEGSHELFSHSEGVVSTRYEDGNTVVFVADFGANDVAVDVVNDTVIVVTDDDQHEFEVPAGETTAWANNGVVTVEVQL